MNCTYSTAPVIWILASKFNFEGDNIYTKTTSLSERIAPFVSPIQVSASASASNNNSNNNDNALSLIFEEGDDIHKLDYSKEFWTPIDIQISDDSIVKLCNLLLKLKSNQKSCLI